LVWEGTFKAVGGKRVGREKKLLLPFYNKLKEGNGRVQPRKKTPKRMVGEVTKIHKRGGDGRGIRTELQGKIIKGIGGVRN